MTILSKQTASNSRRLVNLSQHTDEELHSLMDSVTNEMARRASVNARRRAMVRRLETLAEAEGVTLDEVRDYIKNKSRVKARSVEDFDLLPNKPVEEVDRETSLNSEFESMLQRELAELA